MQSPFYAKPDLAVEIGAYPFNQYHGQSLSSNTQVPRPWGPPITFHLYSASQLATMLPCERHRNGGVIYLRAPGWDLGRQAMGGKIAYLDLSMIPPQFTIPASNPASP